MLTVALALTTLFRALPLDRLPTALVRVLVWASSYSMGVYFAHIYVGKLLEELAFPHMGIVPRSFSGGCVVFAVSFAVCWLVARVPNRHVRALVT
jgi:surface polysaccharide O-acyltransferase-like enzyme